jgi:magnesium-transporting ATPase (P-type)
MSVVIRSNGMIKMYTKGADSIVKSRLSKDNKLNLDDELNRFSRIGLRTLLIGMRIISDSEYRDFKKAVEILPPANKE